MVENKHINLEERLSLGASLRTEGYNCAQTVLGAFADYTNLSPDCSARIAIGLGGGVGGCGGTCGVITAIALVIGLLSDGKPSEKGEVYAEVRKLSEQFKAQFGSLLCCELKCPGTHFSCAQLIENGIRVLHDYLEKR